MIALNPFVTMIRRQDGSQYPFDAAKLKDQILEAFFLSGSPQESWLAEEMVQGVEFSLSQLAPDQRMVLAEERMLDLVGKLFAQTGFQAAAQIFIELQTPADVDLPGSLPVIFKVLDRHYPEWSAEKVRELAAKVFEVIDNAAILCPSEVLITELAGNLFRQRPPERQSPLLVPQLASDAGDTRILLDPLLDALPDNLRAMVTKGIIELLPVSRVFPVLTLRIHFVRYIQETDVVCPATELALLPHFSQLSVKVTAFYEALVRLAVVPSPNLPLCLEFVDCEYFSERMLGAPWPMPGKELCTAFARDIASTVMPRPYKVIVI